MLDKVVINKWLTSIIVTSQGYENTVHVVRFLVYFSDEVHSHVSDLNTKTWQLYDKFLMIPVLILVSFSFSVNLPCDYYRPPTNEVAGR